MRTCSSTKCGGGIAGDNTYKSYINTCYNAGFIHTDKNNASLAGLGGGNGTVSNSYNVGTVCTSGDNSIVGGIVKNTWVSWDGHGNRSGSTVKSCYNMGKIYALGNNNSAGNITGSYEYYNANLLFERCYYLNDMICGNDYVCNDSNNEAITALDEAGFKALAADLNKNDYWWDDTPGAFKQGYCRPVINVIGSDNAHMAFNVATVDGYSTCIDLGLPTDNMFFTTDTTGLVLEACNVIKDKVAKRVMLLDGKDFALPAPIKAEKLTYTHRANTTQSSACLPFAINSEDIPDGIVPMVPLKVQPDGTVLLGKISEVEAGQPFILKMPECMPEWTVEKQDVEVIDRPTETLMLRGTFREHVTWTDECFLPTEEPFVYRRAQTEATLPAFRAFIMATGVADDTLQLIEDDLTAVKSITSPDVSIESERRRIVISNIEGMNVAVFSVTGKTVFSMLSCGESVTVPVSEEGVYVISINGQAIKIMVK